ncbi:hypothetical protein ACFC8N_29825 [Streptomyces sp. NPDC055966]|uniref:hypothetical protein n=1 Tax=Streptomyces sp. NPDC055966 TaxID=3345669 RepID=UPI0035DA94AF
MPERDRCGVCDEVRETQPQEEITVQGRPARTDEALDSADRLGQSAPGRSVHPAEVREVQGGAAVEAGVQVGQLLYLIVQAEALVREGRTPERRVTVCDGGDEPKARGCRSARPARPRPVRRVDAAWGPSAGRFLRVAPGGEGVDLVEPDRSAGFQSLQRAQQGPSGDQRT